MSAELDLGDQPAGVRKVGEFILRIFFIVVVVGTIFLISTRLREAVEIEEVVVDQTVSIFIGTPSVGKTDSMSGEEKMEFLSGALAAKVEGEARDRKRKVVGIDTVAVDPRWVEFRVSWENIPK